MTADLTREQFIAEASAILGSMLPPGVGFALLLFDFGGHGDMHYASNGSREDMTRALREIVGVLTTPEAEATEMALALVRDCCATWRAEHPPEHDDRIVDGELADGAAVVAGTSTLAHLLGLEPDSWPGWAVKLRARLVTEHSIRTRVATAAALLVMELERLEREEARCAS